MGSLSWILSRFWLASVLHASVAAIVESAGPKYARFFGFLVTWWSCTSWMTFPAASRCSQVSANYIAPQFVVWMVEFPGGIDNSNAKWRAVVWAISEVLLLLIISVSLASRWRLQNIWFLLDKRSIYDDIYWVRSSSWLGLDTICHCPIDLNDRLRCLWSHCRRNKTCVDYRWQGHFDECLCHGYFRICYGNPFLVLLDALFALQAPQPFVLLYALAMGKKGSILMTIIAVIGVMMTASVCTVSASRLVFAVARDGVLPMSKWISEVDSSGQPRNAVTVIYIFSALLLCTILPSQVALFSLNSAGGLPIIASYGLIALLRLTMTPNNFKSSYFTLAATGSCSIFPLS